MAMGFVRKLIVLVPFLFLASPAFGQGQLLLIDRSGSMRAYYQNGLIGELGQRLNGVMKGQQLAPVRIGAFNNQVELVSDLSRINVGGPTYLDNAIAYALDNHYEIAWMITDNIMHRSGEEEGKTTVFYERLKEKVVERVVIFPLKQEPGSHNAGIIVYALLLSPAAEVAFKQETEEFARLTPNTVLLPMKPLDRDTIESIFVENEPQTSTPRPTYTDGSIVKETMRIRFKSKFDHLRVVDAEIVNPRVSPEFSRNSLLSFERENVDITPKKITELGPNDQTVQDYEVDVDLGKIRLKRDPISLWQAALRNPNEEIHLDLSFSIHVPKDKFQFSESFLSNYSAGTTEEAQAEGKIYALNQLPLLVAQEKTAINVPHKPRIRVQYPWWLVVVFPGAPIVGLFMLIALGVYLSRCVKQIGKGRPKWNVAVQLPPQATSSIRGNWVIVTISGKQNRMGQIKGMKFVPGAGVTPKGEQAFKEGVPVHLTLRRIDYSLIFRQASQQDAAKRSAGSEKKKDGKRNEIKI